MAAAPPAKTEGLTGFWDIAGPKPVRCCCPGAGLFVWDEDGGPADRIDLVIRNSWRPPIRLGHPALSHLFTEGHYSSSIRSSGNSLFPFSTYANIWI